MLVKQHPWDHCYWPLASQEWDIHCQIQESWFINHREELRWALNFDNILSFRAFLISFWLYQGQATDILIQAEEITRIKKSITEIYAKHTKQPFDILYNHMERDKFLSPDEAKALGLIDTVLEHPPAVPTSGSN